MPYLYRDLMTFDTPHWDERRDGWVPDCQGKMDYDPIIVSISSRTYPSGGYGLSVQLGEHTVFETGHVKTESQETAASECERIALEHAQKIAAAIRAIYEASSDNTNAAR